ncbi:MAG TPA: hydroxymethylglutaryl-CoA synthase, partial [Gammaproteobacteria bacterium]|nr:hydroxymethylglutaryl-CoA synthase [Gammaproteobacteria bacterium]
PKLVAYDLDASGIYTQDVTDVIRPTPWIEVLNEESLYSYLEALEGAYEHYERKAGSVDFNARFARSIYHVPFGGMAYRAHRRLLEVSGACSRAESDAHFARRVLPSLTYTRRIGSSYGGSTLIALLGLIDADADLKPGERISIFGFGSGYCGEFYSAVVRPEARAVARAADLRALLDTRLALSVAQYEACEQTRSDTTGLADWTPDRALLGDWYERAYAGRRMLVLEGVERHHRHYGWS